MPSRGPDGSTAAVTATLVAALIEQLIAEGAPDDLLAPIMIVVALVTALTGILALGLGLARAGGAIRFIPYPVIGGFLGATGWLMISGAVRVVTDHRLALATIGTLHRFLDPSQARRGSSFALALYLALRRARSPFVLPAVLLIGVAAAHLVFALTGTPLDAAHAQGWMFKAPAAHRACADLGLRRSCVISPGKRFPPLER